MRKHLAFLVRRYFTLRACRSSTDAAIFGNLTRPISEIFATIRSVTRSWKLYDFTRGITVALKEFSPDHLVLLGPGGSLGGSIGQIMIENDWLGLKSKSDFTKRQSENPFLIAMGRPEQRGMLL